MPLSREEALIHQKYSRVRRIDKNSIQSLENGAQNCPDFFTSSGYPKCEAYGLCTKTQRLVELGSGIPLYFDFLKCLMVIQLLTTCLFIPLIILQYNPPDKQPSQHAWADAYFSIYVKYLYTAGNIPPRENDNVMAPLLVLGSTILVLVALSQVYYRQKRLQVKLEGKTMYPSDYSLLIRGLPKTAVDEEELAAFFAVHNKVPKSGHIDIFNMRVSIAKLDKDDKNDNDDKDIAEYDTKNVKLQNLGDAADQSRRRSTSSSSQQKPKGEELVRSSSRRVIMREMLNWQTPAAPYRPYLRIAKVVVCWDIREYLAILKRHQKLKRKVQKQQGILPDDATDTEVVSFSSATDGASCLSQCCSKNVLQEYEAVTQQVLAMRQLDMSSLPCGGSAVVTYETPMDLALAADCWVSSLPARLQASSFGYIKAGTPKFRGKYDLKVSKAPNPSDIIWQNIGVSVITRIRLQFLGYLLVLLLTALGATGIWFLIHWNIAFRETTDTTVTLNNLKALVLSVLPSIAIGFLNMLISYVVLATAKIEKHVSVTGRDLSSMLKLTISVLFNSSFIYLIINRHASRWYVAGGLLENIVIQVAYDAIVAPIVLLVDPYTRLQRLYARTIKYDSTQWTQNEYNTLWEGPEFYVPSRLAYIIRDFVITTTYMSVFPLGGAITLLGLIANYLADKYFLLRCCKRPYTQEPFLIRKATYVLQFLAALGPGISILILKQHVSSKAYTAVFAAGLVGVVVALLFSLCVPLRVQQQLCCARLLQRGPPVARDKRALQTSYYQDQYMFVNKYHTSHPIYAALPAEINPEFLSEPTADTTRRTCAEGTSIGGEVTTALIRKTSSKNVRLENVHKAWNVMGGRAKQLELMKE